MTDLPTLQAAALATLATAVDNLRQHFVTPLTGQEMIYMAKASSASAFLADPTPTQAKYPLIYAEVGLTAPDAAGVAQVFAAKAAAWTQLAAAMENARLTGEAGIRAAADEDGINQALWAATAALDAIAKNAGVSG